MSRWGGNKQKQTVCGIERAKNEQSTCTHNKKKTITRTLHALYRLTDNEREEYIAKEHTFTNRFQRKGEMHGGIYVSHMLVAESPERKY